MAGKITDLTAVTSASTDDLLEIVDDPAGTPVSKKITFDNLQKSVTNVTGSLSTGVLKVATTTGLLSSVAAPTGTIVGHTDTQTLTNKTIDADANTITNIENADIKAAAAIAVNKLAAVTVSRALVSDGSGFVSAATTTSTEIGYVNGVTSAIQTQLDAKQPLDSDLTTIAGLTATSDNFIQSKSSAWASRTPTQVTADLIAVVGDSGAGGTKGLVPAPGAGDAAANKFLKADGTWTAPSGSGDVVGPASAVDDRVVTFDGTTGKLIQDSGVGISTVVTASSTTTLTNKTFDADGTGNSITNIENADIKAAAAIAVNKLAAVTVSRALVSDGSGFVSAATTTATEIGYVNGVTSAIQTQLNGKQASGSYITASSTDTLTNKTIDADGAGNSITNIENADIKAAAAIALNKLAATTASRALVSDGSGFVSASSVTATELGYVSGVTSAIQTQINALGGGSATWWLFNPSTYEPPASNYATFATRNSRPILQFDTTTQEAAVWQGRVPEGADLTNGVTVYAEWAAATATSGTIGWDVAFERVVNLDTDTDNFGTAQTITAATVSGTAGITSKTSVAFTQAQLPTSLAAGDMFRIRIRRDVAADTAAGDADLFQVFIDNG